MSPAMTSLADFFKIDENTSPVACAAYHAARSSITCCIVQGWYQRHHGKIRCESSLALIGDTGAHTASGCHHVYPHVEAAGSSSRKMRFKLDALCDSRPQPHARAKSGANDRMVGKHHFGSITVQLKAQAPLSLIVNNGSSIPDQLACGDSKVHIVDDTGKELPAGKVGSLFFGWAAIVRVFQ